MAQKWRRFVLWGVLGLVLVAGLLIAFWPRAVPVDMTRVARGPMTVTVDEEGKTRVRDVYVLSAPLAGRLRRIELEVGDQVIAGKTVVAQIEPADPGFLDIRSESEARAEVQAAESALKLAQAQRDEAEANLEFARTEVARARELITKDAISQRTLDEAESQFKVKKAAVATAEAAVGMRQSGLAQAKARLISPIGTQQRHGTCECVPVTAPVSGRVLRLVRESEAVVQAGDALVEIGNPEDLEIVSDLLSSEAVKVKSGQRVIIDEWGGDKPLNGVVKRVEPYGFTKVSALGIEEQRVNVVIDFTDPPARWHRLGHGYRVEVRIVLWQGKDVLKVPLTALFRDGTRWAVFVVEDGRARLRHVEVGHRNGFDAEILKGLKAGEQVVLHPSDRVADGTRVAARD